MIDTPAVEGHADGSHVVAEHVTEIIVVDLADVARRSAQAGDSDHCVGRRSTAHLNGSSERCIELDSTVGFDQGHGPLVEVVRVEKLLGHMGNDIDERISDSDDSELRCSGVESAIGGGGESRCRHDRSR